jgi:hypothetical protein
MISCNNVDAKDVVNKVVRMVHKIILWPNISDYYFMKA